jgi:hypothetical protein
MRRLALALALAGCGSGAPVADGPGADDAPVDDGPGGPPDAAVDAPPGTPDAAPDAPPGTPDAPPAPDANTTSTCVRALLYNDCDPALDANCFSIVEPLRSDDAAAALGINIIYGGNHDQAEFRSLYDLGGFDLIVFESSSFDIDATTASRLAAWAQGGGKIVFSFWDLDGQDDFNGGPSTNAAVAATLRTALEVTTPASLNPNPQSVYDDPASPVSFFDLVETLPSPINAFSNIGIDDGDHLSPSGGGFRAARFTSATGPGAIAVTHGGTAVVLGFLPIELLYQIERDADADGKPDIEEVYGNAIGYLCGFGG